MRRAAVPFVIVGLSVLLAWGLVLRRRQPTAEVTVDLRPWVEVVAVEARPLRLSVQAQGTVQPRMEAELVAEVGGRVVAIDEALAAGGFFAAGDELVRFDARDYEAAVERAAAAVARAESELRVRRKARQRTESLAEQQLTSDSVLDDARNAEQIARANLADAGAQLKRANFDLERTVVRAPFAGRVRDRHVGTGQFAPPGRVLARVYSVDVAEVPLHLSIDDLAYLDLPLAYSPSTNGTVPPQVLLSADVGGAEWTWQGQIVRTEGALDPNTRMVVAVVQVDDPYGLQQRPEQDTRPLPPGLFVDAEILGRSVDRVFAVPATAYRAGGSVYIVDADDRLRERPVRLLRRDIERVLLSEGLNDGDRVVVSAVESPLDGMLVRVGGRSGEARGP